MTKCKIEEKPEFAVTGIGVELRSSSADFASLIVGEQAFEQKVISDGTIDTLKEAAENHYFSTVSEPYGGKMTYYTGVRASQDVPNTTRIIPFPKGVYLAVSDSSESPEELRNGLINTAFGHVLREVEDYAHVGGSNAVVEMGVADGKYTGEIWIPVVSRP